MMGREWVGDVEGGVGVPPGVGGWRLSPGDKTVSDTTANTSPVLSPELRVETQTKWTKLIAGTRDGTK